MSEQHYQEGCGDEHGGERKGRGDNKSKSKLLLSFLALFVVVVFEVIGVLVAELIGVDYEIAAVAAASIGAALGIVALGGARSLIPSRQALRDTLRCGWWLLAANGLLAAIDIAALIFEPEYSIAESWLTNSLWVLFYCLFVGINEELMFRGLLLGGLLSRFGDTRRGILAACLVTTALFACAHVDWFTLDYANPLELIQAVLKIVQMCIFGLLMSTLTLSNNKLVGPSLLHALGDFLLLMPSVGLMGITLEVSYVSSGSDALPTIMLYLFVIVLYLPMLFSSVRSLRKMDTPQYGPLHKDRTAAHS